MLAFQYSIFIAFALGYTLLIFEHQLKINKAAIALVTGVGVWGIYVGFAPGTTDEKIQYLLTHLSEIAQVLLFLIGAMTIVELVATHKGFEILKQSLLIASPRRLFWVLAWLGFWMSSVLDNLTTILVLVSLIRQTVDDRPMRRLLAAGLVFVVNAGGAWTPIGDITTTMLWIGGRVNTGPLMGAIALPSLLSLVVYGTLFSLTLPKTNIKLFPKTKTQLPEGSKLVLGLGIAGLAAVPVMKLVGDIPPFMGMLASLGGIWVVTDLFHRKQEAKKVMKVEHILTKIDISCVMFFLGVLLAVSCLESAGILEYIALASRRSFANPYLFSMSIGLFSALVDNVPLVAAVMKMFDFSTYPPDHIFWALNAYCAGVGGSLLIIGSAPGVALMSLKDIQFFWYLKKVSWIVLAGYFFGWALIFVLERIHALF